MQFTAFRDGQSIGTFTEQQLKSALEAGVLRASDTYFGPGMSAITPLSQLGRTEAPEIPAVPASAPAGDRAPAAPAISSNKANAAAPDLNIDWDTLASGPVPACCQRCSSAEVKSVQMVYKMGKSSGTMTGFSLSGDVGVAATQNISGLAEELAPPEEAKGGCAILIGGLLVATVVWISEQNGSAFYLIVGLALVASLAFVWHAKKTYAKEFYLWRNRWICLKCGHKFLSLDPAALAALKDEA